MDRNDAENAVKTLLRTVAFLFGAVSGFCATMAAMLFLSLFVDVGLATACALQLLGGVAGAVFPFGARPDRAAEALKRLKRRD